MDDIQHLGAKLEPDGRCRFRVWVPRARQVELHLVAPSERFVPMSRDEHSYHEAVLDGVPPGTRYRYRLDGVLERPDPASRCQPEGVHGPSAVIALDFPWQDAGWAGLRLRDHVFYELHVGAFTPAGTFEAVVAHLPRLRDLGVTALQLMPVAQFPGDRNWGYDGVYPFAVQSSYGGPRGLQALVDACHRTGMAVSLDVVYNHLGPEGNYLGDFAPYFTDRYRTPWGSAVNFDGPDSDEVRHFFIANALSWIRDFHVDALRLDAVHAIHDRSAAPFLEEVADAVRQEVARLKRRVHVIAESNLNDARLIRAPSRGGCGLHAQWSDDFHHALHALLTGERDGYYADFGSLGFLAAAMRRGYAYVGQYSGYRRRKHGNDPAGCGAEQFVVSAQNHDQVGNRARGERLAQLVPFEALKLAAGTVLLSPFLPLLFMGEEYGEPAPFQYFVSHGDPALAEAVRKGRREEFAAFGWRGEIPDPQDEATFRRSRLWHARRLEGRHAALFAFYRELLLLRRTLAPLAEPDLDAQEVVAHEPERVLTLRRWKGEESVFAALHFGKTPTAVDLALPAGIWRKVLDSADERWQGNGSAVPGELLLPGSGRVSLAPWSVVVFGRVGPSRGDPSPSTKGPGMDPA